jgi:hypothetical protein
LTKYKKEAEEQKKEFESKIEALMEQMSTLQKKNILLGDKADRTKEVLRLRAFGFPPATIHGVLTEEKGIDITLQDVIRIVNNIENMPDDLYKYYVECKKDFTDKVTIDPSFFSTTIYKKFSLLETVLSEQLAKARELDDSAQVLKYVDSMMKLYAEMSKVFAKNGIEAKKDNELDSIIDGIAKTTGETGIPSSKSIQFGKIAVAKKA